MPMSSNIPRTRGIESKTAVQTIQESGTPRLHTQDPGDAGGAGTIILPGDLRMGEQVRFMPGSTALADILTGAGSVLTGAGQLWGAVEKKASENAINELQRNYYDRVSAGDDDKTLGSWLDSQDFKPDRWNRDSYAAFRATIKNKSQTQWETEDLSETQVKFAQEIAKNPIKMSPAGQIMYLNDLASRSGNRKVLEWANSSIAALNMKKAEDAVAVVRLTQAQQWDDNIHQIADNDVAQHILANHPAASSLAMALHTGAVSWDPAKSQFINNLDPTGAPITESTPKEVFDAMLEISNPGIAEDPATIGLLMKTADRTLGIARTQASALDAKARLNIATLSERHPENQMPDDWIRLQLNSPENDALRAMPGDTAEESAGKRAALAAFMQDKLRIRAAAFLRDKEDMPLAARIDFVKNELAIPNLPEFSFLLEKDKNNKVRPNHEGKLLLASLDRDLNNMIYEASATEATTQLESVESLADSGYQDPLALNDQANIAAIRAIRQITGKELKVDRGIVSFDAEDGQTTPRGKAIYQVRQAYMKTMQAVNKNGRSWQIRTNPLSATAGELRGVVADMVKNGSAEVGDVNNEITGTGAVNIPRLLTSSESFAKLLIAHGPESTVEPAAVTWVADLFADQNNQKSLLAGASIMSTLQGSRAFTDIYAKLQPQQRILALAALDGYASKAFQIQASSYASAINSADPKTREQAGVLMDALFDRFTQPVKTLMSGLSNQSAALVTQTAASFGKLADTNTARYEEAPVQAFYEANVPGIVAALGKAKLPFLSDSPQEALQMLSADPATRPIVEELLARTFLMSQKTPDEPITEPEWTQIFHMSLGGAQSFYPTRVGDVYTGMDRLFDPGQHFDVNIPDMLKNAWNATEVEADSGPFMAIQQLKSTFKTIIDNHREIRNLPPSTLKPNGKDDLDAFVTEYAKTMVPWAPGRTARIALATTSEIQSQLMNQINPGVPLMIEIYDGDSFSQALPITGTESGQPGLVVSRWWVSHLAPPQETGFWQRSLDNLKSLPVGIPAHF